MLFRVTRGFLRRDRCARLASCAGVALLALIAGSRSLQTAIAEGDTRTLSFHHLHTGENITITYKRNGRYDEAALRKLDWFMRDWRKGEQVDMDPHLFDLLWETNREAGGTEPIQVVCGYRSPNTNSMLRARSSGVAQYSLHTKGDAIDFYIPNVSLEKIREVGLKMQRGGVGFYPTSGSPFVHLDTGSIRHWPRMTREQLVRVFPNGRTVHIPSDGVPLPGYALALADVEKHGSAPSAVSLASARDAGAIGAREEQIAERNAETPSQRSRLAVFDFGSRAEKANEALPPATPSRTPVVVASLSEPSKVSTVQIVPMPKTRPAASVVVAALATAPLPRTRPATANPVMARGQWQGVETRPVTPVELAAAEPLTTASAPAMLAYASAPDQPKLAPARAAPMGAPKLALAQTGYRFDDPWLRAVVMTPSVSDFMTVSRSGRTDLRAMREFMRKPSSSVMMSFSADPNNGLTTDHFSGQAVVFLATANFGFRTASLP